MKSASLQTRISTVIWIMTIVATLTASFLTGYLLIRTHRDSIRNQLEASATALISLGISDFSELEDFEQLSTFIEDTLQLEKVDKVIRIYNSVGQRIFTTANTEYNWDNRNLPRFVSRATFVETREARGRFESLIIPYFVRARHAPYYLEIAIPLPHYSQIFATLWWQYLLLLFFLFGIAFLISRGLSRRLLRPVAQIADHVRSLDPNEIQNWRPLITDQKGLYLGAIVEGINSLTERTRASVAQLRKMSRYVAHELRTPLTIVQGEAEMLLSQQDTQKDDYERVLKSSLEEVQRMSETVDTVLQIGEWQRATPTAHTAEIQLLPWLENHRAQWEKVLERPLPIDFSPEQANLTVEAEPKLLERLIDNLIRNIRNHTAQSTPCFIRVEDNALLIEDRGPGLPADLLDSLNHPKSVELEDKIGIGLHLCLKIAEMCRLSLKFSNPKEGGSQIRLTFSRSGDIT